MLPISSRRTPLTGNSARDQHPFWPSAHIRFLRLLPCTLLPLSLPCATSRSGHTAEAVECYTLCIALQPTQLTAYTNRAEAYLRLQKWDDAITDCNSAMHLMQQQEEAGRLA